MEYRVNIRRKHKDNGNIRDTHTTFEGIEGKDSAMDWTYKKANEIIENENCDKVVITIDIKNK